MRLITIVPEIPECILNLVDKKKSNKQYFQWCLITNLKNDNIVNAPKEKSRPEVDYGC